MQTYFMIDFNHHLYYDADKMVKYFISIRLEECDHSELYSYTVYTYFIGLVFVCCEATCLFRG